MAIAVLLVLSACGGGSSGSAGPAGAAGAAGANGLPGLNTLLRTSVEPASSNCTSGGTKIEAGLDADGNGTLATSEVSTTAYVCNGSNGATGVSGTATLIASVSEPTGTNCPYAGSRITAGLDSNGNTTLDPLEVSSTLYVCNGAPGPGITWVDVTSTTAQAQPNRGYLANSSSPVVVTLPTAPQVGDIVRINGVGTGGWKLAQNAGQSIKFGSLPTNAQPAGFVWTPREQTRTWVSVASSADGRKLFAAAESGELFTSSDAGVTWVQRSPQAHWRQVVSSADGNTLYAAYRDSLSNSGVWRSLDAGLTWQEVLSGLFSLGSMAISGDGQKVFVIHEGQNLSISNDAGQTWLNKDLISSPGVFAWAIASSSDASFLALGSIFLLNANRLGPVMLSTDLAMSWQNTATPNRTWYHLSMSPDGRVITAYGIEYFTLGDKLYYYISTDYGVTWTMRLADREIRSSAMSADGRHLWAVGGLYVAPSVQFRLYYTNDAGQTWQNRETLRNWTSIASSQSGDKLVATAFDGQIYTSAKRDQTTVGTTGFLSGTQYDALELQYIGGGVFIPISYVSYSGLFQFQ